jgi:hypothetical protein
MVFTEEPGNVPAQQGAAESGSEPPDPPTPAPDRPRRPSLKVVK